MCLVASGQFATPRAHTAFRFGICLCWTTLLGAAGGVFGGEGSDDGAPRRPPAARAQIISQGFVLIDGVYIPPPYVIEERDNEVLVNAHVVSRITSKRTPAGKFEGPERGGRARGGFVGMRRRGEGHVLAGRRGGNASGEQAARIERELGNNSMLLAFGDDSVSLVAATLAADIFSTLLSDATSDSKISILEGRQASEQVTTSQWRQIVANFQPTSELNERIDVLLEQEREAQALENQFTNSGRWYGFLSSSSMKYGITLSAMLLAVVALGNLLLYQPQRHGRWNDVNDNSDENGMRRIVVLLALLGGFDLLLTLAAQQAGGFLELNPLGSQLISSPMMLTAFKMTSLLLACWILLRLRRYHGAQVACWWLCMLCTVLTFRWVTFNSLFIS